MHWVDLAAVRVKYRGAGSRFLAFRPRDPNATHPKPCTEVNGWWQIRLGTSIDFTALARLLRQYGPPDFRDY